MASALAHVFALPNKTSLDQADYFIVQQTYRGWSLLGIAVLGALAGSVIQIVALGRDRRAQKGSLVAALSIAASLAVFFGFVFPANQKTANWTVAPPDWQSLRAHWEYGHLASGALLVVAFSALVIALLPKAPPSLVHEETELLIHAPPGHI